MRPIFSRQPMKPVIILPQGSTLPPSVETPVIEGKDFVTKLYQAQQVPVAIVALSNAELSTLIAHPQVFGLDLISLVGVPGGRYDTVWAMNSAPLKRVSVDTLPGELERIASLVPKRLEMEEDDADVDAGPEV